MTQNRFGLFVHFGPYAAWGIHEQALARIPLDRAEYERRAMEFNPSAFDPAEWVKSAKAAGMTYICFTTKHHDGFCMWDTAQTDYKITNTPFGGDFLKSLADEVHRAGLKLSLYYSLPDWHHPDAYNPLASHQWAALKNTNGDFERYKKYVKEQITELLTGYGEIYSLFWDISPKIKDPSFNELVRRLQPNILINDRGFDKGDFSTPERDFEPFGTSPRFPRLTEACDALGTHSWGFRAHEDYHTKRYLVSSIDRVMAMGGSYLLNVGPQEDGTFSKKDQSLLSKVGDWFCRVRIALEGNDADESGVQVSLPNVLLTRTGKDTFIHFPDGISAEGFYLSNLSTVPKSVILLNRNEVLPTREEILPVHPEETDALGTWRVNGLHVYGIDADALADEPCVIRIIWE